MKPWWLIVSFLIAVWVVPLVLAARHSVSRPKWLQNPIYGVAVLVAWALVVGFGWRFLFGMWPQSQDAPHRCGIEPLPDDEASELARKYHDLGFGTTRFKPSDLGAKLYIVPRDRAPAQPNKRRGGNYPPRGR